MNVAILLLNKGRGSGVVAREHAQYLLNQGHAVHFLHPDIGDGVRGVLNHEIQLEQNILPVHEYLQSATGKQKAVSKMDYEEAIAYLPAYEKALKKIIHKVDLVIGHHANLSAIAVANVCKQYGKPYALFLHGTAIEPRHSGGYDDKIWQLIQTSVQEANGLMVTNEYVRDQLVRPIIDLPVERFHIQPYGVDTNKYSRENIGNIKEKYKLPRRYLICPGALTQQKGPQYVVEASKYYFDLAPTIFIGDGELREELEAQIDKRGRFLGFVPEEDKAQLINGACFMVAAPEKKEKFGVIYIEAMSASSPIVTYEGGGVRSIVPSDAGFFTDRDPISLGGAIRILLLNAEAQASMGMVGRKHVEKFYAKEALEGKFINWLSGIMKAQPV